MNMEHWGNDTKTGKLKSISVSFCPPQGIMIYYYYYYYYCLLQLCFHSVAVVLILVQTKQVRINIHKRNNTKHSTNYKKCSICKYTYYHNTHTFVKTPPHTHTHTLQNKLKQPQYMITHQMK